MRIIKPTAPRNRLPILAVTLLTFGLRLAFLGRQSLWYDEAFSRVVAGAPWPVFWEALLADGVHPPGYYLLLRAALPLFGASEFGLRFPSAAVGTLAVPLMWPLGRRLFGRSEAGLLAALLLALNPFAVWYAQEARQYAPLLVLTVAGAWAYVRLLARPSLRRWWPLALSSALSFGLHYFAFVFVLAQFIYLALTLRRNHPALRWWVAAQAVAFLPLLPWAVAVAAREGRNFGIGWIQAVSPADIPLTLTNLAFALSDPGSIWTWLALVFLGLILALNLRRLSLHRSSFTVHPSPFILHPSRATFLLTFLLTPILFTFLLSLRRPLYVDRFFTVSLPFLVLLLAGGLWRNSPTWLRRGTMLVLVVATALACGRIFFDPALAKEDWRAAAAYVAGAEQPGDGLALRQFQDRLPFGHYYAGKLPLQIITTNRQTTPPAEIAAGHRRLWIVQRRPLASTHALAGNVPLHWTGEADPVVRTWLEDQAGRLAEEQTFPGVYVLLYEVGD
ncbi:MAG: glycosyltransferase family 39 protein [Anaerolineae bacterium]